jgi:hypothetical protein
MEYITQIRRSGITKTGIGITANNGPQKLFLVPQRRKNTEKSLFKISDKR